MKSIDKLFQDLEDLGIGFENKDHFLDFLFECSCRKVAAEKIERNSQTIRNMIKTRLVNLYKKFMTLQQEFGYKYEINFQTPPYSQIDKIMVYEKKYPGKDGLADAIRLNGKMEAE